jgi:hypothetical protein
MPSSRAPPSRVFFDMAAAPSASFASSRSARSQARASSPPTTPRARGQPTSPPPAPSRGASALAVAIRTDNVRALQQIVLADPAELFVPLPGGHSSITAAVAQLNPATLFVLLNAGVGPNFADRAGRTPAQTLVALHPWGFQDPVLHFQRRLLLARMLAAAGATAEEEEPQDRHDSVVFRAMRDFHDDLTVALMPRRVARRGHWSLILRFLKPQRR